MTCMLMSIHTHNIFIQNVFLTYWIFKGPTKVTCTETHTFNLIPFRVTQYPLANHSFIVNFFSSQNSNYIIAKSCLLFWPTRCIRKAMYAVGHGTVIFIGVITMYIALLPHQPTNPTHGRYTFSPALLTSCHLLLHTVLHTNSKQVHDNIQQQQIIIIIGLSVAPQRGNSVSFLATFANSKVRLPLKLKLKKIITYEN